MEENKHNTLVVGYYNKEKKRILKNIEKQRKKDEQELKKNAKLEAMKLVGITPEKKETKKEEKTQKKKQSFFSDLMNSLAESFASWLATTMKLSPPIKKVKEFFSRKYFDILAYSPKITEEVS